MLHVEPVDQYEQRRRDVATARRISDGLKRPAQAPAGERPEPDPVSRAIGATVRTWHASARLGAAS